MLYKRILFPVQEYELQFSLKRTAIEQETLRASECLDRSCPRNVDCVQAHLLGTERLWPESTFDMIPASSELRSQTRLFAGRKMGASVS